MLIWKRKNGYRATYRELIKVFERAGYNDLPHKVRKIAQQQDVCSDNETDDSSSSEDSYSSSQPETYPNRKRSTIELPSELSCDSCLFKDPSDISNG